jgi:hypothetical protein
MYSHSPHIRRRHASAIPRVALAGVALVGVAPACVTLAGVALAGMALACVLPGVLPRFAPGVQPRSPSCTSLPGLGFW